MPVVPFLLLPPRDTLATLVEDVVHGQRLVGGLDRLHHLVGEHDAGAEVLGQGVVVEVVAGADESTVRLACEAEGAEELQPLAGRRAIRGVGALHQSPTAVVLAAGHQGERATVVRDVVEGGRGPGNGFPLHRRECGRGEEKATRPATGYRSSPPPARTTCGSTAKIADMKSVGGLARRTLDELPLNIAVIAEDGVILDTNRGWKEFGERAGRERSDIGQNYFEAAREDDEVVAGIRAVLAGDQDVYAYEYPCHSPDQRQWFLMRVTRFEQDGDHYAVVAHLDITERKLAELHTEHLLDRVDGLVSDVTATLVAAQSRAEIESGLVDATTTADAYDAALVGRIDRVTDDVEVVQASERAPDVGPWDADGESAVARAFREREVRIVDLVDGDDATTDAGYTSMAAVPFATSDTVYGVLVVYARPAGVFDPRELRLLRAIGRTVGTAIRAVESARALTATSLVEVELTTTSERLFFTRLSLALECSLTYRGSLPENGEGPLVFFEVSDAESGDVVEWAAEQPEIEAATVLWAHEDDALVEFRTSGPSLPSQLADRGVETRELSVDGGLARFTLAFPADRDAREVVSYVESDHEDVELVAYREVDRPQRTSREVWADLADELTPRQHSALTKAYVSGFFDWPRDVTGDDLADTMGITRATFHQHLRAAERKLVAAFFDDPN